MVVISVCGDFCVVGCGDGGGCPVGDVASCCGIGHGSFVIKGIVEVKLMVVIVRVKV